MTKKITKRERFEMMLNTYNFTEDDREFILHEIELLEKKKSGERKPTATQTANKGLKTAIVNFMEEGKMYTITDFIKNVEECAELSTPKVSALVTQLKNAGIVDRVEEKRKAYFKLA